MPELDDNALLAQFARENSEEAFAALAARHINLVYSVALRKTSNPVAAEEITQAVFIILARKAKGFSPRTILPGWLHQTTRLTAANYLRAEIRRQKREHEAYMQSLLNEPQSDVWNHIAPLLDDALAMLAEKDRDAIVLRFFENKNLREVGVVLGASEDAAKMRINRALEKLRKIFTKRGVHLSVAAIAVAVAANSVQAAPATLTVSVVTAAKGTATTASILTLVKGALKVMAWTKTKIAFVVGVAAIVAIGTGTATVEMVKKARAAALEVYFKDFQSQSLEDAPAVLILRPSKYAGKGDWITTGQESGPDGKFMRRGCPLAEVFATAYAVGAEQVVLPPNVSRKEFDLLVTLPDHRRQALQSELKKQLGLVAHTETRDADVLVLKTADHAGPGLIVSAGGGVEIHELADNLKLSDFKMSDPAGLDVAHALGDYFHAPVIDETALTNSYDIDLHWEHKPNHAASLAAMTKALHDQFGLDLIHDRRSIEMLVVEKAK